MAHGNKKMPLDRYPFMDNDLKDRENGYVTHEELDGILSDYVTDVSFEDYKNTITGELNNITGELNNIADSIMDLNNSVNDLLAFRPLTFDNTGCNIELSLDDNLKILYDYMETIFTKGDTEIKTFFLTGEFARYILDDRVSNCLMVLIKRYNPNKTNFNYLGFIKNQLIGLNYRPSAPNNTNYLYLLKDNEITPGSSEIHKFVPTQKLWGNNYIPTE